MEEYVQKCNVVENKLQSLFECSLCNNLRIQYMDNYFYYTNQNHIKLTRTFEKQITDLAIYIHKSLTVRSVLYY